MSQDKIAFEKLALENEMDIESLNPDGSYANIETETAWLWFQDGLRIATTEANKRIAELQASNNDLKDALYVAFAYCPDDESFDYIETLLATTPAESLQDFENEVIEKCAKICDGYIKATFFAHNIRALKEVK